MAITKPKQKPMNTADEFISGAPDSDQKPKGFKKGNKQQISLTIAPGLLAKIDGLATELGQSRAAVINMAIWRAVEHGLIKE
ncbi:MAG: CopG family transcriptional regulator [Methyloglobulus sp.]|nr:CopG family transcriptional regulator [Methyloglobulus sp.]